LLRECDWSVTLHGGFPWKNPWVMGDSWASHLLLPPTLSSLVKWPAEERVEGGGVGRFVFSEGNNDLNWSKTPVLLYLEVPTQMQTVSARGMMGNS
jgi:hypothetical protein